MKATTWLVPMVVVAAGAMGLALWARKAVAIQRDQAWGITRGVVLRLQSDEAARQVYLRNPELQAATPSEEAFLAEARAHRAAFSALAAAEPAEGYVCLPRLTAFTAQLRGADGTWLELEVQGPSLLDQARGEGIHLLRFASSRAGLSRWSPEEAAASSLAHWERFQSVLRELESERGARELWAREPALHTAYPRPEDLVAWAQATDSLRKGIPQGTWALDREATVTRERGEGGESIGLEFPTEGRKLRMTWRDTKLTFLGFAPPGAS